MGYGRTFTQNETQSALHTHSCKPREMDTTTETITGTWT